jgi:hypothetical protein
VEEKPGPSQTEDVLDWALKDAGKNKKGNKHSRKRGGATRLKVGGSGGGLTGY